MVPKNENKIEGRYDFDGQCMPCDDKCFSSFDTFSVGIFKWLPCTPGGRKGLKRSKVIYRIRGKVSDAERIYGRARDVCIRFDEFFGNPRCLGHNRKSETVK